MEWCLSATQPPDECIHLYTTVRQVILWYVYIFYWFSSSYTCVLICRASWRWDHKEWLFSGKTEATSGSPSATLSTRRRATISTSTTLTQVFTFTLISTSYNPHTDFVYNCREDFTCHHLTGFFLWDPIACCNLFCFFPLCLLHNLNNSGLLL